MMHVQVIDFETYWRSADYTLTKIGPAEYVRSPLFHAQLIGISTNGANPRITDDITGRIKEIDFDNDLLVAHNGGGFDFLIFSERFGITPRYMVDTIWCMRWCGLSSISRENHASLTALLGNGVKRAGTVISDGKQWPGEFTPAEQQDFMKYCSEDVDQCAANFSAMLPYLTPECIQFQSITCRMATEPVFELDAVMLEEYIRQLDAEAEDARQKIMELFHFATVQEFLSAIRSADRFAEMLRSLGVEPPTKLSEQKTATAAAKAEAAGDVEGAAEIRRTGIYTWAFSKSDIEFLDLQEHEDSRVRLLVETRLQFNSSILRSRAETLLKFARMNKPLPIMLSAFKARTSRYSAGSSEENKTDGTQVQNLSKRNPAHLVLRKAIKAPAGYKIVACDSSQVEARCLAWVAGQHDLVGHFRDGRDPYAELAVNFDPQYTADDIHKGAKSGDRHLKQLRNLGKTFVLSAGYGVGSNKVGRKLWQDGIRLSADFQEHMTQAAEYLSIYRARNPAIVYFWKVCGQVVTALAQGYEGYFGGPSGRLFHYGMMRLGPLDTVVPSIELPSGFILRYPGLRAQGGTDVKTEYVYDTWLGKNRVSKRIYGGLLCENCLAEGTLVYTDSGWKPIENISLLDKVYDGVDFVTHSGILRRGKQECITLDGIELTPDHKVLTMEGWREAQNVDVQRLTRPELRKAQSGWTYSPQFQGPYRAEVRGADGSQAFVFYREDLGLALSMFLRNIFIPYRQICIQNYLLWCSASVPYLHPSATTRTTSDTRAFPPPFVRCVARNDGSLPFVYKVLLGSLRWAGNFCLRSMENFRGLLRLGKNRLQEGLTFGSHRRQRKLLPRKLPMDNLQGKQQESPRRLCRDRCSRIGKSYRYQQVHSSLSHPTRLADRIINNSARQQERASSGLQSQPSIPKEVYDIINCGPRHRFVVKGSRGPVIVSNCIQAFAFQLLISQACWMDNAGISLKVNIHDEWVTVVPEAEAQTTGERMLHWMRQVPSWADGCPIDAEYEIGDTFEVV